MNTVIGSGRNARRVPLIDVEWQPKLPWRLKRGEPPLAVRLDVWLRPEIFDLRISTWHSETSCFYDVWLLLDAITPMAPIVETPRPPPVHGEDGGAMLVPCGAAHMPRREAVRPGDHSFTLAGLLRAMESAGYEEMAAPAGLQLTLWLVDRETQPGGLNALFWREHPSDQGGSFYYNPMAGELRDEPLSIVGGGFLCESQCSQHRRSALGVKDELKKRREREDGRPFCRLRVPSPRAQSQHIHHAHGFASIRTHRIASRNAGAALSSTFALGFCRWRG